KDQRGIADVYNSLGIVYFKKNNIPKAEMYYNLSLKIIRTLGYRLQESIVLSQMAILYDDNMDRKIGYLLAAQKIFDEIAPMHSNSLTNIGNIGGTYADIYVNKLLGKGPYQHIP